MTRRFVLDPVKRAPKPRGVKKAANRQPLPPSGRARGDALGLVDLTLAAAAFQSKLGKEPLVLDHVAAQAFGFATALMVRHAEQTMPGRRVWILCADVKTQDHVHAELGVWQCPALYFPRMGQVVNDSLVDPELLAERAGVLGRMMQDDAPVMVLCADSLDEPAPALAEITSQRRTLKVGAKLDVESLLRDLSEAGFERVPVVTERGQFARLAQITQ
jgi:transcription-repair coupling factor (superfamily II helicase)